MSWDDGKHTKVKKVQLTFDDVIRSIEVEYDGTNLKSQRRGTAGTKSDGFTLSRDEYITSVSGYYKTTFSGDHITALTFKTNKKTYGPYGTKTQNYFSADAPRDSQIAGFLGTSGNSLSSLDVHFAPIPTSGGGGGNGSKPGGSGNESSGGDGSKPGGNESGGGGGGPKPGGNESGGGGGSKPGGSGNESGGGGSSKPGGSGNESGGGGGSKPGGSGNETGKDGPGKMGPLGGDKGNVFDDVGFEGVKKITVGADEYSVTYIKIEYIKDGKVVVREHGTVRGELKEFSVDYPNDNITAVGGTYKHVYTYDTTLITSLYFTTSKGFTSPLFGIESEKKGTEFEFKGENGGKLIGFHGRGGNAIDAIGAYFDTSSQGSDGGEPSTNNPKPKPDDVPGKKGPLGGDKGKEFDDVGFEGVKKVTVGADDYSITYIKIEYLKDGKVEIVEHGTASGKLEEFAVDYPNDSITEVGGSYKHVYNSDTTLITSLYFTTSKGFTSPFFGKKYDKETKFEFKDENGGKLIGFHGRGGSAIDAIGAYFDTGSKPSGPGDSGSGSNSGSSPQKLDAQGGKGGNQWDDSGDHDGVTKIHVAVGRVIEQIRFDYVKKGQAKEGPAHGVKGARSSIRTFEISHPDEYLLSVKGWSDSSNKIVGIQFITNKKPSEYYGFEKYPGEEGTDILLEVKDKKIVGFHGFADTHVNSLGAYFAPIASTPLKPSKKLKAVGGDEGASWDDGAFDGVKKIKVGQNNDGVSFVAVEYQNGSQKVVGDGHGKQSALGVETFELTDGEYITSVGVYYDKVYADQRGVTLVTCLVFKTNKQESQPFGMTGGEYVELKEEGNKVVGFHGKASDWVHQIGVYVAPVTK
ncbi:Jacalin-related lectin 5 [Hirschfeldia incana]|nr:Jacalin-related lectin 5 [Hirschfeldia incana]